MTLCSSSTPQRCVTTRTNCPAGTTWNPCNDQCETPFILRSPSAPQSGNIDITGNLLLNSAPAVAGQGDVYLANGKAIRVDGSGSTSLNLGNFGSGATLDVIIPSGRLAVGVAAPTSALDVLGALTMRGIAAPAAAPAGQGRIIYDSGLGKFRVSQNGGAYADLLGSGGGLSGGGTPSALSRFTGATSLGDSGITDDGSTITFSSGRNLNVDANTLFVDATGNRIGLGTAAPGFKLDLRDAGATAIVNIEQAQAGLAYAGVRLARNGGVEKWFVGVNDVDDKLRFRRAGATDDVVIDAGGNVGIGDTTPSATLTVGSGDLFQVVGASGNITTAGDVAVNGGDITTSAGAASLFNTNATTLNIGGAASAISIGPAGATAASINIAGGSSDTGCSIQGFNGNLNCGGTITGLNGSFTALSAGGSVSLGNPIAVSIAGGVLTLGNFKLTTGAGANKVLTSDATGVGTWQALPASVGGSGSATAVPRFTAATTLGDSGISDNGSTVSLAAGRNLVMFSGAGYFAMAGAGTFTTGTGAVSLNGPTVVAIDRNFTVDTKTLFVDATGNRVGIGTTAPDAALTVRQDAIADSFNLYDGATPVFTVIDGGNVGIGTVSPGSKLDVVAGSTTVATFNRIISDGTIISFKQDGIQEGNISVSGTTVSYNAFTGSHYATAPSAIKTGRLVRMTGANRHLGGDANREIIYGIAETAQENDPAVLGSMLGLLESAQSHSDENPYLVMAVGNGDMWVVDEGENIHPGDLLISSAAAGHARKDPGTHCVSRVVARAAERVDWSEVTERAASDQKHAKISVLFEPQAVSRFSCGAR